MKIQTGISLLVLGSAFAGVGRAEDVEMAAEKAMVITFPSQTQRTYKLLAAENASGNWTTLQDGIVGTGGEVTIFYKSESDQKVFFKVETSDGPPGQRSLLSLANLKIANRDLSGYDLSGDDLRGYTFENSSFDGADLSAADLSETTFTAASLINADLSHVVAVRVSMRAANLNGANLEGVEFVGGDLRYADFRNANLKDVLFDGTALAHANFAGQNLTNKSFRSAGSKSGLLIHSSLESVNFSGANLGGADLSRNSLYLADFEGAQITGVNLEGSSVQEISMRGRDLRTILLRGSAIHGDWTEVNASGVDMSLAITWPGWVATGATFEGANLEAFRANSESVLGGPPITVNFINVNFRNANLSSADLQGVVFRNCDLLGADLSYANLSGAVFPDSTGLATDHPGTIFNNTELPDGTLRTDTNAVGQVFAPQMLERLRFVDDDIGQTTDLEFEPIPPGDPSSPRFRVSNGNWLGTYQYSSSPRIGALTLSYAGPIGGTYKLIFSSPTGGRLYRGGLGWGGSYLVGTFAVPQ